MQMSKTKSGWKGEMAVNVLTYSRCQKSPHLISTLLIYVFFYEKLLLKKHLLPGLGFSEISFRVD